MHTTFGHLPYLSARIHLIPSVAMPRSAPSDLIVLMRFSEASLSGWLAAVIEMTSPGACSSILYDSVMSLYPRVRAIGTTSALEVRNWGLSCVLTPRRGGMVRPEITVADILLPRARSSSATDLSMVSIISVSDALMMDRFPVVFKSVAGGGN